MKKLRSLLLLTIVCTLIGDISWALNSLDSLSTWGPIDSQALALLQKLIVEEKDEKMNDYIGKKDDASTSFSFGYSFSGLSIPLVDCLQHIKALHQGKYRPKVLDLGAGHGLTAWKFLVAGAEYKAVEISKDAAVKLTKRLAQAKDFLPANTLLSEISSVVVGDLFELKNKNKLQHNEYAVIWAANFLHYIYPLKLSELIKYMHDLLAPGGIAYIVTEAPSKSDKLMRLYSANREKGLLHPGYVAIDALTLMTQGNAPKVLGRVIDNFHRINDDKKPGSMGLNSYLNDEKEFLIVNEALEEDFNRCKVSYTDNVYKFIQHATYNYIDLPELKALATAAGFLVMDAYYVAHQEKWPMLTTDMRQKYTAYSVVKLAKNS